MPALRTKGFVAATATVLAALTGAPPTARAETTHECLIEPKMMVKLGSQSSGLLQDVRVDRGQYVKAGDIVAELESSIEERNAAIARQRASNDTEVRLAERAAEFEDGRLKRRNALWKTKTISEETLQKFDTDQRMRQLEVERAKQALDLARLEAGRAQALLDLRKIKSPIDGVIAARKMSPGEYVRDESQIVEIAQVDPLYVHAFLPVALFNHVQVGHAGTVEPEAAIGGRHVTRVTLKDSVVDAASSTFLVRLELANPQRRIPSGIRCRVSFASG